MPLQIIAERDFVGSDQERFAEISGDCNPMHMDAVAARRTLAGYPVVHGIHSLLWTIDCSLRYLQDAVKVASIKVNFEKMIYVGDRVKAVVLRQSGSRLRVGLLADGIQAMRLDLVLGDPQSPTAQPHDEQIIRPREPIVLTFEQMLHSRGSIPFSPSSNDLGQMFPFAARVLGLQRLASLACCSFLIGMVCPGLHSIYRSLTLATTTTDETMPDVLHFRVVSDDPDIRLIKIAVVGGGWTGSLDAHARPQPTGQKDISEIAAKLVPGEFSGARALVVGGSRGLGELVSKIIAAGGGEVTITYAVGEADARRVQAEITSHGGHCEIMRFDVREDAQKQLSNLKTIPNELYYMATPHIFQRRNEMFIAARFRDFLSFYVTGFYDLSERLRSIAGPDISIFYPSSVSINDRPANMTEYTMAKVAGEVLCQDMQAFGNSSRVLVRRLPRLPTDQTATIFETEAADPIEVMIPIVREVHSHRPGTSV